MIHTRALIWGTAVMAIALLNIVDVLPDWTTIAAVLTAPFFLDGSKCSLPRKSAR